MANEYEETWGWIQFEFTFDEEQTVNDAHFIQFANYTSSDFSGKLLHEMYETTDLYFKSNEWCIDAAYAEPYSIYYDT